jgi:hypothetical protein
MTLSELKERPTLVNKPTCECQVGVAVETDLMVQSSPLVYQL